MEACATRGGSAVRRALGNRIGLANSVETSPGTDLQVVFPCAALLYNTHVDLGHWEASKSVSELVALSLWGPMPSTAGSSTTPPPLSNTRLTRGGTAGESVTRSVSRVSLVDLEI